MPDISCFHGSVLTVSSQCSAWDLVDKIHKSVCSCVTKDLFFRPMSLQSITWIKVIYLYLLSLSLFLDKNTKQTELLWFYLQNQWPYANFCPLIESQYLWSWDWRLKRLPRVLHIFLLVNICFFIVILEYSST